MAKTKEVRSSKSKDGKKMRNNDTKLYEGKPTTFGGMAGTAESRLRGRAAALDKAIRASGG